MKRPSSKRLPSEKQQVQKLTTLARAPIRYTQRQAEASLANRMLSSRRARRLTATFVSLAFLILIAVVAVATFSPLLAIKQIQVLGTERLKSELVVKALEEFKGVPLPLLDESAVEKALAPFDLIETFAAVASPPNTLQVRIVERQPICIIMVKGESWLFDPAGVKLERAKPSDKLPQIDITEDPRNSQRFRNAISVLLALPENLLNEVELIQANSKDDVRMSLRSSANQRIVWGDSSQSALKSKVLQALMKNNKKAQYVTFDVSSPNAPVVRYDNF